MIRGAIPAWLSRQAVTINSSFWFRPALLVLGCATLADALIGASDWYGFSDNTISHWLYNGGGSGARTLLGTIAGSVMAVAGTTFSITIATLTLASNQMGPRLLRNFTEDHGNQYTLGIFLGTFVYALIVLGSVRGGNDNIFVPHLAVTGATALSLVCVGAFIYFVHHIASRINADTLMEVVISDFERSLADLSSVTPQPPRPEPSFWEGAAAITLERRGYVQNIDEKRLADWAAQHGAAVELLVRPGDYIFPKTTIGRVIPSRPDVMAVVESSISFGVYPTLTMDLEFAVSQLVDIAVRALSPGINDPHTAMRAIDHLGAGLCRLVGRHLVSGVERREGRVVYSRTITDYAGLTDAMFHIIRQNSTTSPAVAIHLVEVLARVAQAERVSERLDSLERHGNLMRQDAERSFANKADTASLHVRYDQLQESLRQSRAIVHAQS